KSISESLTVGDEVDFASIIILYCETGAVLVCASTSVSPDFPNHLLSYPRLIKHSFITFSNREGIVESEAACRNSIINELIGSVGVELSMSISFSLISILLLVSDDLIL